MDEALASPHAPAAQQRQQQHHHHQHHLQQHQQQQQQSLPAHNQSVSHACPPYGSKSVIGRRAKMEDACVAVPYLVELPCGAGIMDELLPPRIAPQLRSGSTTSGSLASDQTGVVGSSGSAAGSAPQQQLQASAFAMALDAATTARSSSGAAAMGTETLHFFGVFDGHGGADAALHCAKSLHERVREVLSVTATPSTTPSTSLQSRGSRDQAGAAAQAACAAAAAGPQASSSSESGHRSSRGGGGDDAPTSHPIQSGRTAAAAEYTDASGGHIAAPKPCQPGSLLL
jgi:protein phosphatase 2C